MIGQTAFDIMYTGTQRTFPTAFSLAYAIDNYLGFIFNLDGGFGEVGLQAWTDGSGLSPAYLDGAVVGLVEFTVADHELIVVAALHTSRLIGNGAHLAVVDIYFGSSNAAGISDFQEAEIGSECHILHVIATAIGKHHLSKGWLIPISHYLIYIRTCFQEAVNTAVGIHRSPQLVVFIRVLCLHLDNGLLIRRCHLELQDAPLDDALLRAELHPAGLACL